MPDDVDLSDDVLVPAMPNVHSHTFQRAMAGMTESRGPESSDSFWTWRSLMYRFLDRLDPGHVEEIASLAFMEMLEAGYASVGEFHYLHHQPGGKPYANPAEMSVRITAAAARTGIGLTLLPVLYSQGGADRRPLAGGQLRFGCDLDQFDALFDGAKRAVAGIARDARIGVAPHSLRAVPPESIQAATVMTEGPVHIHVAEQLAEVAEIEALYDRRPVGLMLEKFALDNRWCLIHATHMEPDETVALAASGAVAGLCPITEASLGDGVFDGRRLLEAGGSIAIGSDSNIRIALSEELRTLEYSQRTRDHARSILCAEGRSTGRTLFDWAAAGGARALARDCGAIRAGAFADLVALRGDGLAIAGLTGDGVLDGWIFAGDDRLVHHVWSAGRHVVSEGVHVSREQIETRYRNAISQLREAL